MGFERSIQLWRAFSLGAEDGTDHLSQMTHSTRLKKYAYATLQERGLPCAAFTRMASSAKSRPVPLGLSAFPNLGFYSELRCFMVT